jgi:DNA-binding transcriptional LysR family regulator
MALDTRQLKYFVVVAEELHFGRAAERLLMSQPPLSQQIRQLEEALGTQLFIRTTRKVEMSPAGELLLERGRRVLHELEILSDDVRRVGDGLQGVLRLGFTGSSTYGHMPRIIRDATRALPGVALSVSGEKLTPQLETELLEHRVDIAVLRPPVSSPDIAFTVVGEEAIIVALPSQSPLLDRNHLTMADFDGEVLVGYPESSTTAQALWAHWLELGITPHYVQRVSETSTLISLVAAGMGAALVPASAQSLSLGGIVFRSVDDAPTVKLAVAWRSSDKSTTVQRFLPLIEGAIRDSLGVAA